jgi:thymidylate synthase
MSEKQYTDLLRDIMLRGEPKHDRTGIGTYSVFGRQLRFNLNDGFPAITTKKLAWKSVVSELLWFIEGSDDERRLAEIHYGKPREELIGKTTIWTANADNQGKELGWINTDTVKLLGPVYGVQWRLWGGWRSPKNNDQLVNLIAGIKNNPDSRRHILSAWDVSEIPNMALPPCHVMCQFYVSNGKLSCHMYQRSVDVFLGLPFNIASYALLTHMIASVCNLGVGELIISTGDTHIYANHIAQVSEQLDRKPYHQPKLWLNRDIKDITFFKMSDIRLDNYVSHGTIKADMAV